jgi:5-methylcytosine-specific restriction endonuclease McrA
MARSPKERGITMGEWIAKKRRLSLYERDQYKCRYCGKDLKNDSGNLSLDHVVPKSKGGKNNDDNLVTACAMCQWKKLDKNLCEINMNLTKLTK